MISISSAATIRSLVLVLVVNTRTNDRLDTTCFYRFVTGDAIIVYTQVLYVCTLNFV